ncbi:hypothetical protein BDV96DRAFT_640662 [Lophiotrema nucula]|uniref:Uncharacterized protein n=1 Tax=Lophiotrema nucula TaxID=690887 RepID=A0A6A5ZPU8_9PLEO|nr:hypothetical protein BDV96DRAFT_640662 [Lophiotrema nucula]
MFQIPSAKRIRRNELQSPATSPRSSPDPDLAQLLRSQARTEYTFTTPENDDDAAHRSVDEEAELILFATNPSSEPQSHKIRLASPVAEQGEPGFAVKKPRSYYFADEGDSEREAELKAAAIDGKTVLALAREPWPGCALPWKVKTITPTGMKRSVTVGHSNVVVAIEESVHKRRRKGKKSRIAIRKKLQANEVKREANERLAKEKEEAEKEKRTRRNREKKLKQKARNKAKRSAEGAAAGSPVEEPESVSDAGAD